ncbi:hypothetical protein [Sporosarcina sp. FSL W7-1283]|uniref:hypothetical protein n=1 Tax=Sporosarcina sp. FSL W7-1283 TaxID=2921560 RepID=UPI0030FC52D2
MLQCLLSSLNSVCKEKLPYLFLLLNVGALQAVGGVMRQTGGLPDWLIAGAIR